MKVFIVRSKYGKIRFHFLEDRAPVTCRVFLKRLPFKISAVQARFAGEEIWIPQGPLLKVKEENSTRRPKFGGIGYVVPKKNNDLSRSLALIYGDALLSEPINVFGRVHKADGYRLRKLGKNIWLKGRTLLDFTL